MQANEGQIAAAGRRKAVAEHHGVGRSVVASVFRITVIFLGEVKEIKVSDDESGIDQIVRPWLPGGEGIELREGGTNAPAGEPVEAKGIENLRVEALPEIMGQEDIAVH